MNVSEIANGSEVKIHASIGGHGIVLMTTAIFGVSAGLLVKPMEYFGKYMQFLEPSSVEIKNKRDDRVYKFKSTTVTPVKTRYGYFHLIRCESALEPENSRKAERFSIDKLGLMAINGNNLSLRNCIIHDLSMRGISIILDDTTRCRIGDKLNIMFRYGSLLHSYEVNTVVVRYFKVKEKNAVGCSISNMNVDLIRLLGEKRNEKYGIPENPVEENTETNLNPEISKKQQIMEVEEDIAAQLIPERNKRITEVNPFAPEKLEHISEKTLRQQKKEDRQAQQAKEIENLLDLRDI
jgi:hypothetical protein